MERIERLRELAVESDGYREREQQLLGECHQQIEYRKIDQTEKKTELGLAFYLGGFFAAEIVLIILIHLMVSFLVMLNNYGWSWSTFIEFLHNGFTYVSLEAAWFIWAVPALPFALLALFVAKKVIRAKDRKAEHERMQRNEANARDNQDIKARNDFIQEHNRGLEQQIELVRRQRQELVTHLRSEFVQYPVEYLTVPVVDYIEKELQSGRAKSINQAIVHYEAGMNR